MFSNIYIQSINQCKPVRKPEQFYSEYSRHYRSMFSYLKQISQKQSYLKLFFFRKWTNQEEVTSLRDDPCPAIPHVFKVRPGAIILSPQHQKIYYASRVPAKDNHKLIEIYVYVLFMRKLPVVEVFFKQKWLMDLENTCLGLYLKTEHPRNKADISIKNTILIQGFLGMPRY